MKKIITIFLMAILMFSFAGCKKNTMPQESSSQTLANAQIEQSSQNSDETSSQEQTSSHVSESSGEVSEVSSEEITQSSSEPQTSAILGENPISPKEYQKLLGHGMDVDWCKTPQGKEFYNKQAVIDFKNAGVNHVRIRVRDNATEELLILLDRQIDDCLSVGLIPIIAYQGDEFKNEPNEENIAKMAKWWETVAERYKDKSHLLAFDLLIEATDALNKQPEKLNEIYEASVTAIRKTNPTRIIMMSPRLRSDAAYLNELKIPTNHNGYMMAEWHFYAAGPSKDNERKLWTTGTDAEKKLITDKINIALNWQNEMGIYTWVGAWMAGDYNDGNNYTIDEQVTFAKFMTSSLTNAGIPFAVNSDTKFYDRETNKWVTQMQPVFDVIYSDNMKDINSQVNTSSTQSASNINVGFNTKATLSYEEQCKYVSVGLKNLQQNGYNTNRVWLRLNGGTISQKTYPSDWTDDNIIKWVNLQKEFNCKYVFVINFNDLPENQLNFYNYLVNKGMEFSMIELGNEQYLPKFAEEYKGDNDEVTKRTSKMTPQKYIELSNEYIKAFSSANLPFAVQFAPNKEDKNDYTLWNKAIVNAINKNNFSSSNLCGTIHLYEREGDGTLDVTQISRIRKLLNKQIPFAVTEFGVADKNKTIEYQSFILQEKHLTQRIMNELKNGDMLFNQVLYTDYKTATVEVFHSDFSGITPKGEMIVNLFKEYLK